MDTAMIQGIPNECARIYNTRDSAGNPQLASCVDSCLKPFLPLVAAPSFYTVSI